MNKLGKIEIAKAGHKKNLYSLYFVVFDPKKHFVGTDEIKDMVRKKRHMAKAKIKAEYDTIFATWEKVGVGRNRHVEFNLAPKSAANVVFLFPKKHRKTAYNDIKGWITLPVSAVK